jgi:hypothetical protein
LLGLTVGSCTKTFCEGVIFFCHLLFHVLQSVFCLASVIILAESFLFGTVQKFSNDFGFCWSFVG